jgi:hypothetical protein
VSALPPKETGEADLSAIDHVARQVATEARSPKLVVEKSTVPALTGVQLQKALAAYSPDGGTKFQIFRRLFISPRRWAGPISFSRRVLAHMRRVLRRISVDCAGQCADECVE